ncbi:Trypsin-like peptidase domain-containing protein [Actinokineospora alba]|uniref:Trypsin-like peptidase domain-containing protein n=1 Tax=Actinokineospora alba TaxID=504798 RepID=A0A1H0UI77_9PSEU|nr:trypsin-like peptidase [Actinokineospora alba]SDH53554.1 Trypsin-like peptidase domain-containing protein [Actinokineospora alba]SDP65688.1 Trypsin-like peptidase domain-containing protein [Actinokineospora alba]
MTLQPKSDRRKRLFLTLAMALAAGSVLGTSGSAVAAPDDVRPAVTEGVQQVQQVGEEHAADIRIGYAARSARQVISKPGSAYIKVHFASLALADGDRVTVANPAGTEVHTYSGDPTRAEAAATDSLYTKQGDGFWALSITGDTAVVTLHRAGGKPSTSDTGLVVDKFTRGFTDEEQAQHDSGILSVCGTDARKDAVCYQQSHPTEYAKSRSVAKILKNGASHCTAWRVGSTNRLFTNNHCIASATEMASMEIWFDYACATCGGNNPKPAVKVTGAQFLKTSASLDYTLFSVNNFASIESFGYLLLDVRAPVQNERIYITGHGSGDPNELSVYEDTQGGATCDVDNPRSDSINMGYYCDTTGGSSGSPVLAASSHKVIALHHLGGCLNEGTRIELIYPEVKDLIDNGGGTDPPPTGGKFENTNNVNIPDAGAAITSDVTVTGQAGNAPSTLKVNVDIKHTWRGDLVIDLVAPDGTAYRLKNSSGNDSADNVITTYTVNASTEVANGTWKLKVQDVARYDTGYIDAWSLQF